MSSSSSSPPPPSSSSSSSSSNHWVHERMQRALEGRRRRGTLRRLPAAAANQEEQADPSDSSNDDNNDNDSVDFSSNDYLGLARDPAQLALVEARWHGELLQQQQQRQQSSNGTTNLLGATGSRLLSGDSAEFHRLEAHLAGVHSGRNKHSTPNAAAALLCNSGYDANLTVVSSLACDAVLYDEFAHNSLHMGMRLWQSQSQQQSQQSADAKEAFTASDPQHQQQQQQQRPAGRQRRICQPFRHNSVSDLRAQLRRHSHRRRIVVLIESVYSMDGDVAPVPEILDAAQQFGAAVVVDEAHGLGVCGPTGLGVLEATDCQNHPALLAAVYTFGKAAGCHGAVVICHGCCSSSGGGGSASPPRLLRDYLINYGYPLIYSTALPRHALAAIGCAYETLTGAKGGQRRRAVAERVREFRTALRLALQEWRREQCQEQQSPSPFPSAVVDEIDLLPSAGPIQALRLPGNAVCAAFCDILWERSRRRIRLFPIRSPTVPAGQERVRLVLHAHNTAPEVAQLVRLVQETLRDDRLVSLLLLSSSSSSSNDNQHSVRDNKSIVLPPRSKL